MSHLAHYLILKQSLMILKVPQICNSTVCCLHPEILAPRPTQQHSSFCLLDSYSMKLCLQHMAMVAQILENPVMMIYQCHINAPPNHHQHVRCQHLLHHFYHHHFDTYLLLDRKLSRCLRGSGGGTSLLWLKFSFCLSLTVVYTCNSSCLSKDSNNFGNCSNHHSC